MDEHVLLEELGQFPLLNAMFGRRSRRFGVGMAIPDGPLAYASTQPPSPLVIWNERCCCSAARGSVAGTSGWNTPPMAIPTRVATIRFA